MNISSASSVTAPRTARLALSALLLAALALTSAAASATTYRIVLLTLPPEPLPPPGNGTEVVGINEAGEIIGYMGANCCGGATHALVWSPAPDYTPRLLDEGAPGEIAYTVPRDINSAGVIVGVATLSGSPVQQRAVMWGANGRLRLLGGIPGEQQSGSVAYAINDHGTIVGGISPPDAHGFLMPAYWNSPQVAHAFVPGPYGFFNGNFWYALSDSGMVAGTGWAHREGSAHASAFRFSPGRGFELLEQFLPGPIHAATVLNNMNAIDQAVGHVNQAHPGIHYRAILWEADGSTRNLGILPGASRTWSFDPTALNNVGVVVGSYYNPSPTPRQRYNGSFVWTAATGMQDVVDLIDPLDPLYSLVTSRGAEIEINGINDAGVLVGHITWAGGPGSGQWIPAAFVPES